MCPNRLADSLFRKITIVLESQRVGNDQLERLLVHQQRVVESAESLRKAIAIQQVLIGDDRRANRIMSVVAGVLIPAVKPTNFFARDQRMVEKSSIDFAFFARRFIVIGDDILAEERAD